MIPSPNFDIQDERQLDYVLEAIDDIDYELSIARHRLPYLFENTEEAFEALTHLRVLIQDFARTCLCVSDGSESECIDESCK